MRLNWFRLLIMYLKTECVPFPHSVLTSILVLRCVINTIYQTLPPLFRSSPCLSLALFPSLHGCEAGGPAREVWHSFCIWGLMYYSADVEHVRDCSGTKLVCSAPLLMIQCIWNSNCVKTCLKQFFPSTAPSIRLKYPFINTKPKNQCCG